MSMYEQKSQLILASSSPRRRELLASCGLSFSVVAPGCEETPLPLETPADMVGRLAALKAECVARNHPQAWVIGADTVVVLDGEILGKPSDAPVACDMLGKLQGRGHDVWGGFSLQCVACDCKRVASQCTRVWIAPLLPSQISAYVQTGEPMDKAGAYAAQGLGASFISRIEGSYTNVVGLPLAEVLFQLERVGAITPNRP